MAKWLDPAFAPREFTPWAAGWYAGGIVEKYENDKGDKVYRSGDEPSQKGDSRNILLCCVLTRKNTQGFETLETRNMFYRLNYRPEDLNDETIGRVRDRAKQMKGQFPQGDPDWRPFMSFQGFRQLELVAGEELPMNGHGFDLTPLIGKYADFRIRESKPNAEGKVYMEIAEIAPQGTKVK